VQPYYDVAFLLHLQVQKLKTRGQLSSRQDNAIILRDMINDRLRILAILLIVWSLKIYSNKKLLFEYFTRFYSRLPVNGSYLSAMHMRQSTDSKRPCHPAKSNNHEMLYMYDYSTACHWLFDVKFSGYCKTEKRQTNRLDHVTRAESLTICEL